MKSSKTGSLPHGDSALVQPDEIRIAVANLSTRQFLVHPSGQTAAMDLPSNPDAQKILFSSLQVLGLNANLPESAFLTDKRGAPPHSLWLIFDNDILALLLKAGVKTPVLDALRPMIH
jgi:hypothetical protein